MNFAKISVTFLRAYGQKLCARSASSYIGYDLKNYRSLLSVKGADASVFLQNVITDDIYKLRMGEDEKGPRSLYAMILNSRGRVMYDVLVYLIDQASAEREYFVEVDSSALNDCVTKLLEPLKLRKKVKIERIDAAFKLFALVDPTEKLNDEKLVASKDGVIVLERDPRYSRLGYRAIVKTNDPNSKISSFINNVVDDDNLKAYKQWIYKNGVPENREDIKTTNAIPLEYNLVYLNGVSFDKGCYLGQELIAKTHHTGVIRKRVMPVRFQLDSNQEEEIQIGLGSEIKSVKTGKAVGKLINYSGQYGIAMVRLENVDNNQMYLLDNKKEKVLLSIQIPKYWPLDGDSNIKALNEKLSK